MASNYSKSSQPYIDLYNNYKAEQTAVRDAYRRQLEADRDNAIAKSNAEYDNTAKQNYINYMQTRKSLPEQLNALGIRGGASESSLIRMGSNYGSNVASNEASRNTALAALRQQYEDKMAAYDEEYDNKLLNAYLTAVENQLNWDMQNKGGGGGGGGGYRRSYGGGGYSSGGSGGSGATAKGAAKAGVSAVKTALSKSLSRGMNVKKSNAAKKQKKKQATYSKYKYWG